MKDPTKLTGGERGAEVEEKKPSPRLQRKMLEGVPERARAILDESRTNVLGLLAGITVFFEKPDGERVPLTVEGQHDVMPLMEALGAREETFSLQIMEAPTEMLIRPDSLMFGEPFRMDMFSYNMLPRSDSYIDIISMDGDSALIGSPQPEMRLTPGMHELCGLKLNVSVENGELFLSAGSGKSEPVKIVGVAGESAILQAEGGGEVMVKVLSAEAPCTGLDPLLMVQIVRNIQRIDAQPLPQEPTRIISIDISKSGSFHELVVDDGTDKPK